MKIKVSVMLLLKLNMLLFSFLFTGFTAFAQTGFYSFGEEAGALSGKAVGPFGKVIIGKVRNNQAQFFLYVCNGAPANHTGTVMGTLKIVNNKAVYKQAHSDKYCQYAFLLGGSMFYLASCVFEAFRVYCNT